MNFAAHSTWLRMTAVICAALLAPGDVSLMAQQPATATTETPKVKSPDQLDSLVAPLALYPDPLLAQVLAASTYPLEIVQAARWLKQNTKLTGENLTKAAAKQPWDPSVQALVAFPQALNLLDTNIGWTQDLGNAFLDQQSEVMDSIQRMRMKAKNSGKLESSKEQNVEVKMIESKTIIEIQPSNPQIIYVPSYDPVVVYGAAPIYAYPPVAYPYGAVAATAAISFGVGVMMGAFWGGCCGGGGWGWNAGWGNNNININNNFNSRYGYNNVNGGNRNQINGGNRNQINGGGRNNVGSGNSNWQHNPDHRRSVPYGNRDTAQRFNGTARDSAGGTQRFDGRGNEGRNSAGQSGNRGPQASTRESGANRSQPGSRGSGAGSSDRIGNRSIDSGSRSNSALGNSGSRERSQASSDRGFSSSRSSGGGFSGGGASRSSGRSSGGGRRR